MRAAAALVEATVVNGLALRPRALPVELARAEGTWKGAPVTLIARAYDGDGVRFVRFIDVCGAGLDIANALALPAGDAPVLGVDVVTMGPRDGLLVADLSPMNRNRADEDLAELARRSRVANERDVASLPGWAARWFSPHALCARVPADEAAALLAPFAETFVRLVRDGARSHAGEATEAQSAYLRDHREEDRTLGMLTTMFGAPFAGRFIHEVMFPVAPPLIGSAPGS